MRAERAIFGAFLGPPFQNSLLSNLLYERCNFIEEKGFSQGRLPENGFEKAT
jgi:hypothetical protein